MTGFCWRFVAALCRNLCLSFVVLLPLFSVCSSFTGATVEDFIYKESVYESPQVGLGQESNCRLGSESFEKELRELKETERWNTWIPLTPPQPTQRYGFGSPCLNAANDSLYVYGGVRTWDGSILGDLWSYNFTSQEWLLVQPTCTSRTSPSLLHVASSFRLPLIPASCNSHSVSCFDFFLISGLFFLPVYFTHSSVYL